MPYSGNSSLARVVRVSAVSLGLVYGAVMASYYKGSAKKASEKSAH
uniref:Uncharacterized protein n=1 Tax=Tetraselmis sp. GSL018 TaxID=582737 RepID=A0A061RRI0_9CHLO